MRIAYPASLIILVSASAMAQTEPVAIRPSVRVDSARLAALLDTTARRDSTSTPDSTAIPDSTAQAAARRRSSGCWRARPRPHCVGFFVTDFGLEFPLYTTRRPVPVRSRGTADFGPRVVWGLGVMRNVGRDATGPVFSLNGETASTGVSRMFEWRYRRWLSETSAVDVGLGRKTTFVWQPGAGDVRVSGLTAMAGWTPNRWIGVSGRLDVVGANGRSHRAVMLGIQSTRGSEFVARMLVVELWRALLAEIGIEWESD